MYGCSIELFRIAVCEKCACTTAVVGVYVEDKTVCVMLLMSVVGDAIVVCG